MTGYLDRRYEKAVKSTKHSVKKRGPIENPVTRETLKGYQKFLRDIKSRIYSSQIKAALSVNRELILLYWQIGRDILQNQENKGWGAKIIDHLAEDLRHEFPEMKGFSARNLKYMRAFAQAYSDEEFVQQLAAQIPWYHNCTILDKLKDSNQREWYIRQTIENGWSRAILVHQIETDLYERQVSAEKTTNFSIALPPPQSNLIHQTLKDPYVFDFLSLRKHAKEKDLERALHDKIRDFLLELGAGFAYMGNQYHLEVDGQDFYIDILFYHHRLRCLIAIELKMEDFKPEFAGKMNFYLSALDDLVRHPDDQPSVGIILCKGKGKNIAEYALRDMSKPIGISEYRLTTKLPKNLAKQLPKTSDLQKLIETNPE